jgi:hypothetical protein
LKDNLRKTISTYLSQGKTITTKVTWSFTDTIEGAMHYSNGIILMVNFSEASRGGETALYITPLLADPNKIEYIFAPGSQFEVQSVDETVLMEQQVLVIKLQPRSHLPTSDLQLRSCGVFEEALPSSLTKVEASHLIEMYTPSPEPPHTRNKAGGRKCDCIIERV